MNTFKYIGLGSHPAGPDGYYTEIILVLLPSQKIRLDSMLLEIQLDDVLSPPYLPFTIRLLQVMPQNCNLNSIMVGDRPLAELPPHDGSVIEKRRNECLDKEARDSGQDELPIATECPRSRVARETSVDPCKSDGL